MKKQRLISAALAALLVSLAACGEASAPSDETTVSDESSEATTAAVAYTPEKVDYEGYEFKILYRDWGVGDSWEVKDVFSEGENGESINDAVYQRNRKIEEDFNIKFGDTKVKSPLTNLRTDVLSGDATYDAVQYGIAELSAESMNDMLVDLKNLDGFNFDEPWWDNMMMESIASTGHIYFALGDININDNNAAWCILFNKALRENYSELADYYKAVKEGKWTLDLLNKDAKTAAKDLNGDSQMTWDADQWGMIGQYRIAPALLAASGYLPLTGKADGSITYNLNSEGLVNAFDRIYTLINDVTCVRMYENATGKSWEEAAQKPFMSGKALFFMTPIATVSTIRDMSDDFEILPIPKLNEKQAKYDSIIQYNNGTAYAILNNGADADRSAVILDAMAFYSKELLTPAYYDITLQRKASRDNESSEMLDLIFSSGVFDYSQAFNSIGITDFIMNSCKGENNFASGEASNRSAFMGKIEELTGKK